RAFVSRQVQIVPLHGDARNAGITGPRWRSQQAAGMGRLRKTGRCRVELCYRRKPEARDLTTELPLSTETGHPERRLYQQTICLTVGAFRTRCALLICTP